MLEIISVGIAWMGAIAGAIGVLLLGLKRQASKDVFVWFLISSICWLQRGWYLSDPSLLVQQSAYLVFNLIGVWRYFAPKRRYTRADLIRISYPACNAAFARGSARKEKAALSS